MPASLAERRALLTSVLGFAMLDWPRTAPPPEIRALDRGLSSWPGIGAVIAGMSAQGFNLELREYLYGWRADFFNAGNVHHEPVATATAATVAKAVQRAAWAALNAER